MKHIRLLLILCLPMVGTLFGVLQNGLLPQRPTSASAQTGHPVIAAKNLKTCREVLGGTQANLDTLKKLNFHRVSGLVDEQLEQADDEHEDTIAEAWQNHDPLSWVVEHVNRYAQQSGDRTDLWAEDSAACLAEPMIQTSSVYDDENYRFDRKELALALLNVAMRIGGENYYDTRQTDAGFAIETACMLTERVCECECIAGKGVTFDDQDALYGAYWCAYDAAKTQSTSDEIYWLRQVLIYVNTTKSTLPDDTIQSCRERYKSLASAAYQTKRPTRPDVRAKTVVEKLVQAAQSGKRSRSLSF